MGYDIDKVATEGRVDRGKVATEGRVVWDVTSTRWPRKIE